MGQAKGGAERPISTCGARNPCLRNPQPTRIALRHNPWPRIRGTAANRHALQKHLTRALGSLALARHISGRQGSAAWVCSSTASGTIPGTTPARPRAGSSARRRASTTGSRPMARPGPTGEGGFQAEAGRYHLYVSLACPWAHRTLIFRKLKKLEDLISVSIVSPLMFEKGWTFNRDAGLDRRSSARCRDPGRHLSQSQPEIFRPRDRAGAVGQEARHHRQQRVPPRSSGC